MVLTLPQEEEAGLDLSSPPASSSAKPHVLQSKKAPTIEKVMLYIYTTAAVRSLYRTVNVSRSYFDFNSPVLAGLLLARATTVTCMAIILYVQ